jgi:pimeloyl-ACP methyl ester carboxylesterase
MKFFILFILTAITAATVQAQNISGSWKGDLPAGNGGKLGVIFNFSQTGNTYTCTFDVPDQKAFGIPCSAVVTNDSISIKITTTGASFKGKLVDNIINGVYGQNGASYPLILNRQLRPQAPVPPYAYNSEDLEYDNTDKSVHFGATLTRPKGNGKYSVVIIISGSGAQDRDGTLFGHKLYAVLADHLTKNGIAVLRVDDRGTGKTTLGNEGNKATSASFAKDVEAGLQYLLTRTDIDKRHIGLIGHSEGGIIAPMVAARRKDVSFIVLWGAPIVGGAKISTQQNADQLRQALHLDARPDGKAAVEAFTQLHAQELNLFSTVASEEELNTKAIQLFNTWKAAQRPEILKLLMVTDNGLVGQTVTGMYGGLYKQPWFHNFITYKPVSDLSKVTCSVLAIGGAKDTQVNTRENLQLITEVLTKNRNKNFKTVELPSLNHLLQTAQTGSLAEYGQIEETISPVALNVISSWIKTQVK